MSHAFPDPRIPHRHLEVFTSCWIWLLSFLLSRRRGVRALRWAAGVGWDENCMVVEQDSPQIYVQNLWMFDDVCIYAYLNVLNTCI